MPRTGVTSLAGIQRRFEPPVALFGFVVRHVVVVGCDGSKRGAVRSTTRTVVEGSKRGAARTAVVIRTRRRSRTRVRTRRRSRTVGRFDGSKRGAANRPYPIFVAISVRLTGNYLEE